MPRRRASDRLRLAALLWVAGARVGLWILPLRWNRSLAAFFSRRDQSRTWRGTSPQDVGEAVRAAQRAVPRASCLVQAVAAGVMLRRIRLPAVLFLGANDPGQEGRLAAHAWVESNGQIVVGGDAASMVQFARFDLAVDPSWRDAPTSGA